MCSPAAAALEAFGKSGGLPAIPGYRGTAIPSIFGRILEVNKILQILVAPSIRRKPYAWIFHGLDGFLLVFLLGFGWISVVVFNWANWIQYFATFRRCLFMSSSFRALENAVVGLGLVHETMPWKWAVEQCSKFPKFFCVDDYTMIQIYPLSSNMDIII